MGNCCSIPSSVESIIENFVIRGCDYFIIQAKYICKLEENVAALSGAVEELTSQRNDLQRKVEVAEQQQQQKRLDQVQLWLSKSETMITAAKQLVDVDGPQEMNKLCLGGCFSRNCMTSYKVGKKVAKMIENINDHKCKGAFEEVAENEAVAPVEARPSELPVGMESAFEKVWSYVNGDSDVGIIGLYGLGGVGKTTLLTQINNQFSFSTSPIGFDIVIWVVVSKDHTVENVQEKIGDKIGLSNNESWRRKSVDQKATDICKILGTKKFVLLLDDLWERVDLIQVGIPLPSPENGSKLVFTTRFLEVCGKMGAQMKIKVECLKPNDAWKLFEEKVGEETLNSHPNIRRLAKEVAEHCGGLPLALTTIGRAMACKKAVEDWKYAIEKLRRSSLPAMENEVYPLLKFSYDSLPGETMRSCLLYCCLYPEDWPITITQVIDLWFCEGLLDEFEQISSARLQGHHIINSLVDACLLERDGEYHVKMHDVIRDMALWIACEDETIEKRFFVKAGVGLSKAPEIGKWEGVRRISLMKNRIHHLSATPNCPNLETLLLVDMELRVISDGLFEFMPKLKVLSLEENPGLRELPKGISKLVSLEYLNLSSTGLKVLPIELNSLRKLKYLSLLETQIFIPPKLICCFSELQAFGITYDVFRIPDEDDKVVGNEGLIEDLGCLPNLNMMWIEVRGTSAVENFLSFHNLQGGTEVLRLLSFSEPKVLNVLSLANTERLHRLQIINGKNLEDMRIDIEKEVKGRIMVQPFPFPTNSPCFNMLHSVLIFRCNKLKDITWLILAPELRSLDVKFCSEMEEILSKERFSEFADVIERNPFPGPFPKLEKLSLFRLSKLKSIYWDAPSLPCLKEISVRFCDNLKKLPLNSDSAKGNRIRIKGDRDWWEELEWEDEVTAKAFSSSFELCW